MSGAAALAGRPERAHALEAAAEALEDEELADEVLAEVEGERGALPLLAFALARPGALRPRIELVTPVAEPGTTLADQRQVADRLDSRIGAGSSGLVTSRRRSTRNAGSTPAVSTSPSCEKNSRIALISVQNASSSSSANSSLASAATCSTWLLATATSYLR